VAGGGTQRGGVAAEPIGTVEAAMAGGYGGTVRKTVGVAVLAGAVVIPVAVGMVIVVEAVGMVDSLSACGWRRERPQAGGDRQGRDGADFADNVHGFSFRVRAGGPALADGDAISRWPG